MANEIKTWQERLLEQEPGAERYSDITQSLISSSHMKAEIAELRAKVESLAAAMEAVLEAGEEWARYVEVDTAPMQLIKYLERARDASMAKEKA